MLYAFSTPPAPAAGQFSASYAVLADVLCEAAAPLIQGASGSQATIAALQRSATGSSLISPSFLLFPGFVASVQPLDSDGDGITDNLDPDDDGDGIPDDSDPFVYDYDADGRNNLLDDDADGDLLANADEAGQGSSWLNPDSDGDDFDDYAEWVAGTDAQNSNSVFTLASAEPVPGTTLAFAWQGVAGRTYMILATNSLAGPGGDWTTVGSTSPAATGPITYTTTPTQPNQFYRVAVTR